MWASVFFWGSLFNCVSAIRTLHISPEIQEALHLTEVERRSWASPEPFAQWLTTRTTPIVLTDTFVAGWSALELSPEQIINQAHNGLMRDIYSREKDNIFAYWHTRALSSLPEFQSGKAQVEQAINVWPSMSSAEFLQRVWSSKQCEADHNNFYYSNAIDLDFGSLRKDLPNIERLSPWGALDHSKAMIWIGPQDITTPIHNDAFHNVYAQVKGTKRFILVPPTLHRYLHLFPALHPKHQQSQVLLEHLSSRDSTPSFFPNFFTWDHTNSGILVVTLQPGEILFIPDMWYHHVTSLSPSISINVWTEVNESTSFEALFQAVDPIESGCLQPSSTAFLRAMSAREYLVHLLLGVLGGQNHSVAKEFVRDNVLVPRYFPLMEQNAFSYRDPSIYLFCDEDTSNPSPEFFSCVEAQATAFRSYQPQSILNASKLELRLADVIEFTALWAVGPSDLSAFLLDFVRC